MDQVTDKTLLKTFNETKPLGKSDHSSIVCSFNMDTDVRFISSEKRNWSKFTTDDIIKINSDIDWSYSSNYLDVESTWNEFYEKLQIFENAVPVSRVKFMSNGQLVENVP